MLEPQDAFSLNKGFLDACVHALLEIRGIRPVATLASMTRIVRQRFRADLAMLTLLCPTGEFVIPVLASRRVKPLATSGTNWINAIDPDSRSKLVHGLHAATSGFWTNVRMQTDTGTHRACLLLAIHIDIIASLLPQRMTCHLILVFEDPGDLFPAHTRELQMMMLTGLIREGIRTLDKKEVLLPPATSTPMLPAARLGYLLDLIEFLETTTPAEVATACLPRAQITEAVRALSELHARKEAPAGTAQLLLRILGSVSGGGHSATARNADAEGQTAQHLIGLLAYWAWWRGAGRYWIHRFRDKSPIGFQTNIDEVIASALGTLEHNERSLRQAFSRAFAEDNHGVPR